ncbi:MAG: site-specific integrase [Verrucomicrobiota bacterium]|nr:site-specific integrase [Verrucomicrobiota bacterium]
MWTGCSATFLFHGKRYPSEMGGAEVAAFLTHLVTERKVASSTQNQALNALVFLYGRVLERDLGMMGGIVRAKTPETRPVVLTKKEVHDLLALSWGRRPARLLVLSLQETFACSDSQYEITPWYPRALQYNIALQVNLLFFYTQSRVIPHTFFTAPLLLLKRWKVKAIS